MNTLPTFLTNPNPEIYLEDNYVVFDFETTSFGKGLAVYPENRVVGVSWKCGPAHPHTTTHYKTGSWVQLPCRYNRASEYEQKDLLLALESASFVVAHNAKFDLQWAERCGLDLTNVLVYDTLLGEYVLGGNKWKFPQLSLEKIAQRRFKEGKSDIVSKMIKSEIPVEDIPEKWLEEYCIQDVKLTEKIFREQRRELYTKNLLNVHYVRCLLTPVLADIEKNGLKLDEEVVRTTIKQIERKYTKVQDKLNTITGGINTNSPKQVGDFLYDKLGFEEPKIKVKGMLVPDRTPKGDRKTNIDTINSLKVTTKSQKEFIQLYKESNKLDSDLTKYLRKFMQCCEEDNGILLANFNQANTWTHRLSSTGLKYSANFQNFQREFKKVFTARNDGWLIGECDGSQLEFRVAVHLGRDGTGLHDICQNTDIHSVTASVIWPNISWDGISKHPKRQPAKNHTFKPLYYGRSGTPNQQKYYKFFREKYSGITKTQQRWIDEALNNKCLVTEWGLIYYWPDIEIYSNGYVKYSTSICNYPVQALATAEIIPISLIYFWHRLKRSNLQMFIVNTIHDSIVVELPPNEIDDFKELSRQTLIDDTYSGLYSLYGITFTVPLGTEVKIGTHWGSGEETIYTANEEFWLDAAKQNSMIRV